MSKKEFDTIAGVFFQTVQSHPIHLVKTLIQVGHEPLAPFKSKDILGRHREFYPNSFQYFKHIKSIDGISGLYRGLGMNLLTITVQTMVHHKVLEMSDENENKLDLEMFYNNTESTFEFFRKKTAQEINTKCWSIIISHPFHVMALRCMAQFVGGETTYSSWNVFQNAVEIYRGEGIAGFFSGLIPRMLFSASAITIANGLAYLLRTYVLKEEEFESYINIFSAFLAHTITYPLSIVTTISCVSGSSLIAANPPNMPLYRSWLGVFTHLYETNGFKRGSTAFYRIATPAVQY